MPFTLLFTVRNAFFTESLHGAIDLLDQFAFYPCMLDSKRNPGYDASAVADGAVGKRVLLVEDNVNQQRMCILAFRCKFPQHEMKAVGTGREALELAEDFLPEVVVVDLGLPDMDGCELCQQFLESAALRNALLISLSGSGEPEDFRRSEAAGFARHVVKPPDLDALERAFHA